MSTKKIVENDRINNEMFSETRVKILPPEPLLSTASSKKSKKFVANTQELLEGKIEIITGPGKVTDKPFDARETMEEIREPVVVRQFSDKRNQTLKFSKQLRELIYEREFNQPKPLSSQEQSDMLHTSGALQITQKTPFRSRKSMNDYNENIFLFKPEKMYVSAEDLRNTPITGAKAEHDRFVRNHMVIPENVNAKMKDYEHFQSKNVRLNFQEQQRKEYAEKKK